MAGSFRGDFVAMSLDKPLGEGTTVELIAVWLEDGVDMGATRLIVVLDTFDYTASPEYVMPDQDAKKMADAIALEDPVAIFRKSTT